MSFSRADPPPISVAQLPWVQKQPLSPWLLIHFHGGGFVAQTSKSHEVKNKLLWLLSTRTVTHFIPSNISDHK